MTTRINACIRFLRAMVWRWVACVAVGLLPVAALAIEFNSTGGTTAANGLRVVIDPNTQIQVRRLNNSGQVYEPNSLPPSANLDNGVYLRANGQLYGPSHFRLAARTSYNTQTISATTPANPAVSGVQQTATSTLAVTNGPQVSIVWKYTTPLDFLIAEVQVVIPSGFAVSAANPVRYSHAFDTFLGGSDQGCGVTFVDTNGKRVIGTYPPPLGVCTSTTTIPAGVTIVESFRERSGLAFSAYCANDWNSFWDANDTCSVNKAAAMNNLVSNTLRDTGIGVQYQFIAPGTYTFSYDFVVGSPTVPPYDHLEIRHDGMGTLCPEPVQVLACLVSTLPCPAASIVSTGTLTGQVTTTPAVPAVSKTPSTFTVGSGNSIQTVTLQASGSGGVVLGSTGLSTIPLNGTRCFNTMTGTESCALVFAGTPCVGGYDCLETGAVYNNVIAAGTGRNPLNTKLSGTAFNLDVMAVLADGTPALTYTATSGVTVELFNVPTTVPASCSAYTGPIASRNITFATADLGRKALPTPITMPTAHRNVICRVTDTNVTPTLYACSSDRFAIRPQSLDITTASQTNTGLTGTPKAVAGSNFDLSASSGVTGGYTGTPAIDQTKVVDHNNATIQAGTLTGAFGAATGVAATGSSFRYTDVGNIQFQANAVVDTVFAAIDDAAGDCVAGSSSNTLAGGKYGCIIGSNASARMGRWYPSHYSFSGSLTPACMAGSFTYMDQDALAVNLVVKAHASTGGTASATDPVVSRLVSGFTGRASVTFSGDNASSPVAITRLVNPAFPVMPSNTLWNQGQVSIADSFAFSKLTTPDGPYDSFRIQAAVTDADGSTLIGPTTATGTTRIRYGQLRVGNAYGSELLPLPIPVEARYWNGSAYVLNTLDSCTAFAASAIQMGSYTENLNNCETQLSPTSSQTLAAGRLSSLQLSKPGKGNSGSVLLTLNVAATPVASATTCVSATATPATAANMPWFGTNPAARATFGKYRSPLIYLRENY
ncbi:hypothetical protein os4_02240 [Comamonadaceae bacterium OS-4]|nr:hypothetical protein os4_02240 [Comamonadaceae bacterium OS-4]